MSEPRLCRICSTGTCEPDRRMCTRCRHDRDIERHTRQVLSPRARRRDYKRDREPYKGKHCHACEGMPWRRPVTGRCKCGGVYGQDPELAAMRPRFWRTEAA